MAFFDTSGSKYNFYQQKRMSSCSAKYNDRVNKTGVSCHMTVAYGCDFFPAIKNSTVLAELDLVSIKRSERLSTDCRLLSDDLKGVRLVPLPSQQLTSLPYLLEIFF